VAFPPRICCAVRDGCSRPYSGLSPGRSGCA
jgi:hypothetical protein